MRRNSRVHCTLASTLDSMTHDKLLLVEGTDDLHAIRNLVYHHDIVVHYAGDERSPAVSESDLTIQQARGQNRIGTAIRNVLRLGNVTTLGVVADADEDHEAQWESVINHLFRHLDQRAFTSIDDFDVTEGWVGESVDAIEDPVCVGCWLMPDNVSQGALEDFAAQLVPETDDLWPHAGTVIENLPRQPFKTAHRGKARMHTYLAWQDPPREPIGRAISNGPLTIESPLAAQFVTWMRRLFQVDDATGDA